MFPFALPAAVTALDLRRYEPADVDAVWDLHERTLRDIGAFDPEYTSQRCSICGHTERANRNKKRFKCRDCGHQDHSDRGASVNIALKGIEKHQNWTVPALNSLPVVRKVRRQASGAVDAPTVTHDAVRGYQTDGIVGVSD